MTRSVSALLIFLLVEGAEEIKMGHARYAYDLLLATG